MKYYQDFVRDPSTFAERVGEPEECDAALGQIASNFSALENMIRNVIQVLLGVEPDVALIVTAELSFRQLVDVYGSLWRNFIAKHPTDAEASERLDELLYLFRKAGELRNTYIHSSYWGVTRKKVTAKGSHGLKIKSEQFDSALLLDVAEFIIEVAAECEILPIYVGFADNFHEDGQSCKYLKNGQVVASFSI